MLLDVDIAMSTINGHDRREQSWTEEDVREFRSRNRDETEMKVSKMKKQFKEYNLSSSRHTILNCIKPRSIAHTSLKEMMIY